MLTDVCLACKGTKDFQDGAHIRERMSGVAATDSPWLLGYGGLVPARPLDEATNLLLLLLARVGLGHSGREHECK